MQREEEEHSLAEGLTSDSLRSALVDTVSRSVKSERVLDAMRATDRHAFIPEYAVAEAYLDCALPIGYGVTISQPSVVGLMTEALCLSGGERVLEVGTGSGYQAAVLSRLAVHVDTLEARPELARRAYRTLAGLGVMNVDVHVGDGWRGLPVIAPFDRILVSAAARRTPESLVGQLAHGGVLVLPVGETSSVQRLTRFEKRDGRLFSEDLGAVRFVPLVRRTL